MLGTLYEGEEGAETKPAPTTTHNTTPQLNPHIAAPVKTDNPFVLFLFSRRSGSSRQPVDRPFLTLPHRYLSDPQCLIHPTPAEPESCAVHHRLLDSVHHYKYNPTRPQFGVPVRFSIEVYFPLSCVQKASRRPIAPCWFVPSSLYRVHCEEAMINASYLSRRMSSEREPTPIYRGGWPTPFVLGAHVLKVV